MSLGSNRHPAPCATCDEIVAAETGRLERSRLSGWLVYHPGPCQRAVGLAARAGLIAAERDGRRLLERGKTSALDVLREWRNASDCPDETGALDLAIAHQERVLVRAAEAASPPPMTAYQRRGSRACDGERPSRMNRI